VLGFWRSLLGQNVIELADLDAVCETIALADVGSAAGPAVSKALATIRSGHGALVRAAPPDGLNGPSGNARL
jgi:hypothetical protein